MDAPKVPAPPMLPAASRNARHTCLVPSAPDSRNVVAGAIGCRGEDALKADAHAADCTRAICTGWVGTGVSVAVTAALTVAVLDGAPFPSTPESPSVVLIDGATL